MVLLFLSVFNYLVDAYLIYSARCVCRASLHIRLTVSPTLVSSLVTWLYDVYLEWASTQHIVVETDS